MTTDNISDLVNSYVNFASGYHTGGWRKCYCELCGDGSHKKGPRGGWLFQGEMAFYRCFNCGVSTSFDPDREHPFAKDMRAVLDAFGIPKKEYTFIAYKNVLNKDKETAAPDKKPEAPKSFIKFHDIPDYFYKLSEAKPSNQIAIRAREFLMEKYGLKADCYDFMLSSGITKSTDVKDKAAAISMLNRVIIPYYKNGKLIYYQGRSLEDNPKKKYLNMDVPKNNIIFNMDAMYRNYDRPLYVFEGAMDALHVDGVAVMENNLSANQIEILNKSPRMKVIVPDRNPNKKPGAAMDNKLVQIGVLEQGWGLALPEIGRESKDLCEGIVKYGKMHCLHSLVNTTYSGMQAKVMAGFV